ncbi:NAD-dependent epimerase/dehydratase family protein [Rufibacter glacialis]|uniref:NAD-dependent epimerase/dehydratase family protein n=1 Tax=Rufibacter glacialis TaxID=1259555 RepID=A0A5M8QSR0_9BACT|nr:NAD-dependent epimerase/dehydratase family protein [Rufibacter glacialis]KAA6437232.1 NAD-dependent epimerase/dehydratase family protein [Rufibacter glacialis]GGK60900.1 NAD-dependent epimerase [Rufibacter glacialis]
MKHVLVTGGSGLVGHFLLQRLLATGCKVTALYRQTGSELTHPNLHWVQGDILDPMLINSLVQQVEEVYHCAGFVSYAPQDAALLRQINVEGTTNIVDACLEKTGVRLCHVSSIAAINRKKGDKTIQEDAKWDPVVERSMYASSKHFAEMEVWRGISEGLKAVIVNPSVILGPRDMERSSTQLFKYISEERAFYTHGYANFVDVRDVTEAMLRLMNGNHWGERFIINGHQVSYLQFFQKVAALMGKKAPFLKVPDWLAEVLWRVERVRGAITGTKPLITKETARIAKEEHFYSNEKIKAATGLTFRSLEDTLRWSCGQLAKAGSS